LSIRLHGSFGGNAQDLGMWTSKCILSASGSFKLAPIKLRHSLLSRFLFQRRGPDPLFKHHILDFITIVFKHYAFAFF
jgi:hypothetical protein